MELNLSSPQCVYPGCRTAPEKSGQWCGKHQNVKCLVPWCKSTVIPKSSYCRGHDEQTGFFIWLHNEVHKQAVQQAQQAAMMAKVKSALQGSGGNGSGKIIIPGRG